MTSPSLETIINLGKRRGIVFPSSEIYGGLRATWDYGPIGVALKTNVQNAWWRQMVQLRDDIIGLESAILMHPRTWEASNHVESFNDPLVECLNCHRRHRQDHIGDTCPDCGGKEFTEPRNFNLMFKTFHGPVEEEAAQLWLRPETAQGMFVDFQYLQTVSRKKIPFGIAQIGRAFRNEITPGGGIFRTREFDQMEIEYFVEPGTDEKWHEEWIETRKKWYIDLGMNQEKLRLRDHPSDELSHYSKRTVDVEYEFPWGWGELEGIANRTDYDLKRHSEFSGQDLSYFDQQTEKRFHPFVIEPSAGANRSMFAFLIDAYTEEETTSAKGKLEKRTVLKLHPMLAPYKAVVLPLSRNEALIPVAKSIAADLRSNFMIDYDDSGSIGRRYRRHDEIGTPFAVTIDFDSISDEQVTVRERDSMAQERLPAAELVSYLQERITW